MSVRNAFEILMAWKEQGTFITGGKALVMCEAIAPSTIKKPPRALAMLDVQEAALGNTTKFVVDGEPHGHAEQI